MSEIDVPGVLNEDLDSKLDAVLEYVKDVPARLDKIEQRLETIESNILIVTGVARVNSADINELKIKSHSH